MTNEVLKKLKDHDKKFAEHDKRFDQIDKRFDQIDGQIELIVTKLLDHDNRLERIEENMATKQDLSGISNTLDKLVGLVQKTDQELVFMGNRVNRLEEQTSLNTADIKKMKPMLGLS
jgi:chromosome segregation ATPase